jgi:hypothetical protein
MTLAARATPGEYEESPITLGKDGNATESKGEQEQVTDGIKHGGRGRQLAPPVAFNTGAKRKAGETAAAASPASNPSSDVATSDPLLPRRMIMTKEAKQRGLKADIERIRHRWNREVSASDRLDGDGDIAQRPR